MLKEYNIILIIKTINSYYFLCIVIYKDLS